jgi:hypothetical protein
MLFGAEEAGVEVCRCPLWGRDYSMSMDMPIALDTEQPRTAAEVSSVTNAWFETALTLLLTAATVLFVSFIAVVSGLV